MHKSIIYGLLFLISIILLLSLTSLPKNSVEHDFGLITLSIGILTFVTTIWNILSGRTCFRGIWYSLNDDDLFGWFSYFWSFTLLFLAAALTILSFIALYEETIINNLIFVNPIFFRRISTLAIVACVLHIIYLFLLLPLRIALKKIEIFFEKLIKLFRKKFSNKR